mmetsp:Transcript_17094/g.19717  ORF Transcript_17094/g.19717 Transcript_17094/m.19717 type:complete len:116 (+) Transcript_17094:64-411(+)
MFAVWVIGSPLLAFYILFRNRRHLEEGAIRNYMLVLYQGLRPEVFYWEFVNTFRKVLILLLNVFLTSFSAHYRILFAIVVLVIILRVQEKLKPYKNEDNNRVEMLAIMAAITTLY